MVDRIKQVMEYYEETPAGFAEKLGINRSNLTHLFSGRNQPSLDFAKRVLTAYPEVSTEWLIMGVGIMIKDPEEIAAEHQKKTVVQTNLFEMEEDATAVDTEPVLTTEPSLFDATPAAEIPQVEVKSEPVMPQVDTPKVPQAAEVEKTKNVIAVPQVEIRPQPSVIKDVIPQNQPVQPISESNIQRKAVQQPAISNSRELENVAPAMAMAAALSKESKPTAKKIEKIIFFFDDDTFKVYNA